MNIFEHIARFFGNADNVEAESRHWKLLKSAEELEDIKQSSHQKAQVIYKHSTRCSVSYMAMQEMRKSVDEYKGTISFHLVDVIGDRQLSRFIADELSVRHESPQLIILKDGAVQWHGSHFSIKKEVLRDWV